MKKGPSGNSLLRLISGNKLQLEQLETRLCLTGNSLFDGLDDDQFSSADTQAAERGGEIKVPSLDAPAQVGGSNARGSNWEVPSHGLLDRLWVSMGPNGAEGGQVENIVPNDRITGAIHAVLTHPTNPDVIYVSTINGGVWKTSNATDTNPNWIPQTDFQESLSMSGLAFDLDDPTFNTVIATTGNFSSYGSAGSTPVGIYKTTDGGDTWSNPGSAGLVGEQLSGVAARGDTIVVTSALSFGGIFRSTDGGASFSVINGPGFGLGDDFFDLAVDPTDPAGQRLYAAGEDLGIFRSDDFGATWTAVTDVGFNFEMYAMITNPDNNNTEIVVHPVTGRVYVAILLQGQPRGVFYSDSADTFSPTWTRMDIPVLPQGEAQPVVAASDTNPIVITSPAHGLSTRDFVIVSGATGNTAANGFFKVTVLDDDSFELVESLGNGSYTGGGTWTQVTGPNPTPKDTDEPGSQGRIHFSLAVDPTNDDIIYMGGDRQDFPNALDAQDFSGALFRGDASLPRDPLAIPSPQWDHLTHGSIPFDPQGGTASVSSPHADSRDMAFDANGDLIEVDDGGIFRRTSPRDNTGDWFSLAGDLQVAEFHDIAYDTVSNVLLAGSQDNGTQVQTSAFDPTWQLMHGGDGGDVAVDDVSLAAQGQSIRYTSFQFLAVFRKTIWDGDGNLIDTQFPALSPLGGSFPFSGQFSTPIQINHVDPSRIAFGGSSSVYESLDQGETISEVGEFISATGSVSGNALDYGGRADGVDNPDVMYVGNFEGNVFVRTSAGESFVQTDPSPSFSPIRDIVMNTTNWRTAYAIDDFGVYVTTNAGDTWGDITGNLFESGVTSLRSLAFIDGFSQGLVVGTNKGVFALPTPSATEWFQLGGALPNAPVWDMDYDALDDILVAGTLGRGGWALPNASFDLGGGLLGDFNRDGELDCADIDELVASIAAGVRDFDLELTGDTELDAADIDRWLQIAGAVNLPTGNAYLSGDANLDGIVDALDFIVWNEHKFTNTPAWCSGDFDASGDVGQSDFDIWNDNRFQSASGSPSDFVVVPEIGTNPFLAYDINYDGHVTALDVLLLVNELNHREFSDSSTGQLETLVNHARFADSTSDGRVTAADAIAVINYINRPSIGVGFETALEFCPIGCDDEESSDEDVQEIDHR